jgi:iron complex transport system permease protein
LALFSLLLGVIGLFLLEIMIGAVHIPLSEVINVLLGGEAGRSIQANIIIDFRLPRALTALAAGAALGVGGLMMQTIFRNPLASAWTLGLDAGASLGVALAVVVTGAGGVSLFAGSKMLSNVSLATAAAAGTTLILMLILIISRRVSIVTLLIVGLMFHYLGGALVSLFLHLADEQGGKIFSNWEDGSYVNVTWSQLQIIVVVTVIGLSAAHILVKPLNALLLGEKYARTLGLSVAQARFWIFGCIAVLAGVVTAFCGTVTFIGVAVPHLCRGAFNTSDHRVLMPAVMLMGSLLALAADLVTHLPWKMHVFHMNTVNALIGAPVILWIILRAGNMRSIEL